MVTSDRSPGHRISLQGAWEFPDGATPVWIRPFGRPVDLPAGERVDLVIVAPGPILASAMLNGRPVSWSRRSDGAAGAVLGRSDVTAELAARNELRLHADAGPFGAEATPRQRGPLPESVARVWLEIHREFPGDDPFSVDHPGPQA